MALRTFVSFEADFPTGGEPPGGELAEFVSAALNDAGLRNDGPDEREGWAWDINHHAPGLTLESIVGLTDDPPRQWQIHSYAHLPYWKRWSGDARTERDETLRRWVETIDRAIRADPRFCSIRWYESGTFDADHGESWDPAP